MKIEEQVVSLDIAKQLKSLGVRQESYFRWIQASHGWVIRTPETYQFGLSAFTITEIAEIMRKMNIKLSDFRHAYCEVMHLVPEDLDQTLMAHNLMLEPDFGGQMVVYLLEQKLIDGKSLSESFETSTK